MVGQVGIDFLCRRSRGALCLRLSVSLKGMLYFGKQSIDFCICLSTSLRRTCCLRFLSILARGLLCRFPWSRRPGREPAGFLFKLSFHFAKNIFFTA